MRMLLVCVVRSACPHYAQLHRRPTSIRSRKRYRRASRLVLRDPRALRRQVWPIHRYSLMSATGRLCCSFNPSRQDRKSGVEGKSVSVRVALGGRRIIKKKKEKIKITKRK